MCVYVGLVSRKLAWNEAVDATFPLVLRDTTGCEPTSDISLGQSADSFELVDNRVEDSDDEDTEAVIAEARMAEQIAAGAFLQHGQPYPGDDHIQDEQRFLIHQNV
ncbi:hypothetical protein B0H14DRAFT_3491482 [Mycena olivaceomarginata]|nr:hypothetical protein B0H14DRAFT_3491482 [Mycena olivaceomarginata]